MILQDRDLDESPHQAAGFSSYCKQDSYVLKHLVIVIEGCNQSPIMALYISMRKSSCTVASDDTGGGRSRGCLWGEVDDTQRQNYRVLSNHPNKSNKDCTKYSIYVSTCLFGPFFLEPGQCFHLRYVPCDGLRVLAVAFLFWCLFESK